MRSVIENDRLARIKGLVAETCALPGEMAEFGVYLGGSARIIADACPNKPLHLFDTFTGMPETDSCAAGHRKGDFGSNIEEVKEYLKETRATFHQGFFPDTAAELGDLVFSFVHMDADIYQSTLAGIEYFKSRVVRGGIIVFDDYGCGSCPAVKELVHQHFSNIQIFYQQCYIKYE